MNLQGTNPFTLYAKSPLEDILIKKLVLSHDPDGRHLDSEELLHAMENIMFYATISEVLVTSPSNCIVCFDSSSII